MNKKITGHLRPAENKKIIIQHKFVGHSPVAEAMAPMLIQQLQTMRKTANPALLQEDSDSDSVEESSDNQ